MEDEIGVRNVVTEMIKALGYEATVAENATHALELLDTASVDLLLTDVIMPDMRGPELYRSALQAHPELSALFVSGYTEEVISEIPSGGNKVGYLAKPFTMTQLADAIEAIIAWQRVE